MYKKGSNIFELFTVFVLGVILGFLISPEDGKTNRNQVKNKAFKLVDELRNCLKNIFCLKNCSYNENKQSDIEILTTRMSDENTENNN